MTTSAPSYLPRRALLVRAAVVLLAVLAVHGAGLWTLLRDPQASGPLFVLVMVPLLATVVGWEHAVRGYHGPNIHDRQLDYIVGTAAAVGALTLVLVQAARAPQLAGSRLDLLALPMTAIAAAVLLLGARMVWQLRAALAVLLLTWPLPWEALSRRLTGLVVPVVAAAAAHLAPAASVPPGPLSTGLIDTTSPAAGGGVVALPVASFGGPLCGVFGGLLLGLTAACIYGGSRSLRVLLTVIGAVAGGVLEVLALASLAAFAHHGQLSAISPTGSALRQVLVLVLTAIVLNVLCRALSRLPRGLRRPYRLSSSPVVAQLSGAVPRARLALGVVAVWAAGSLLIELSAGARG